MSHRPDDKSVQVEYCMPEGEHNPAESDGHINPSVLGEEPELHPDGLSGSATSTLTSYKVPRIPPRRLALCGGGVRGVAHVGVMKGLADAGMLSCVKEMIGISAGSLFSLLWVLGYTLDELERLATEFDFTLLRNIEPESVFAFPDTYGLDSGEALEKLILSILRQKGFSPNATFADIHKLCPVHLRCYATELQTSRIREFSTSLTPNVEVRLAIRASMSLPFFYTPVKDPESDALLVDGGLLNNLPMVFLQEHQLRETWGVIFHATKRSIQPVKDLTEFLRHIYDGATLMRSSLFLDRYGDRVIKIPTDEFGALSFGESKESRLQLIELAREKTLEFLYSKTKPLRRFSAA
jgi:predicted acylesterase/phospholipase RssA